MKNTISDVPEADISEGYRSRRPLPKRGQIKSKIAANAVHSIVSALSRASSRHHRSTIKPYSREIKDMRNH